MEQFLTYFPSAFSWGNLAVLILGSAGGLFFGAMPGLSPTMAVALLVPFTFYLPDPSWRRVHQRCGGRLHLGHPAEHSRSAFKHRHAVRRVSDGQAGTGPGSPLHRFCKLPYRRRIRRAGHDPVLPPDG